MIQRALQQDPKTNYHYYHLLLYSSAVIFQKVLYGNQNKLFKNYTFTLCDTASRHANELRTAWSDRSHQSVHLHIPVFDVGARLAKFPLCSLSNNQHS